LFIFAVPISSRDRGQVELNEIKIKLGLIDSYNFRRSLENLIRQQVGKSARRRRRRPNLKDRARRKQKTPPAAAGGVKFSRLEQKLSKKLMDFFVKSLLQHLDFERFLIVRTISFERKAL